MAFGWLLVVHTTLIGSFFEFGENERFEFMIEPLLLVLTIALLHRSLTRVTDSAKWSEPPGWPAPFMTSARGSA